MLHAAKAARIKECVLQEARKVSAYPVNKNYELKPQLIAPQHLALISQPAQCCHGSIWMVRGVLPYGHSLCYCTDNPPPTGFDDGFRIS